MENHILTPGGYLAEKPNVEDRPDIELTLSYTDAFGIIVDGMECETSIEPIVTETFGLIAEDILGLLNDALETMGEEIPDSWQVDPLEFAYHYEESEMDRRPDFSIHLPYAVAHKLVIEALKVRADRGRLLSMAFEGCAEFMMGMLLGASASYRLELDGHASQN